MGERLIEVAKQEKYYEDIKEQISALQSATLHNKETDLITFKKEIKALIEQEIASRYYLQEGAIESTFEKDRDILTAVEVLNDQDRYLSLLVIQ